MAVSTRGKLWLDGFEIKIVFSFNIAEGLVDRNVISPNHYCNKDVQSSDILQSRLYRHIEFMESN